MCIMMSASVLRIGDSTSPPLLLRRGLVVPVGEVEEDLPVARQDRVAAAVIMVRQAPVGERLVERRQFGCPQVLRSQKSVNRSGGYQGEELARGIAPLILDH